MYTSCVTTTTIKVGNISITAKRQLLKSRSATMKRCAQQGQLEKHSNLNSFLHFNTLRICIPSIIPKKISKQAVTLLSTARDYHREESNYLLGKISRPTYNMIS